MARGLAIDAVVASQSGHLGLPLGCAEIGAVLYGHALSHDPANPGWLNRDRFVLSAGHGSMFLYAWLHLSGYRDMTLDEIKRFRQLGSKTPGHPELTHAPSGVETTTGPLGQGIGNAVGMAVGAKMAEARFNTAEHVIFDHHIVCLAGDGCMQEGVAMEALSFAGHQKLDNLILIYDSNAVTLDAMAKETQSEDTAKRFEALGFDVQTVDGHEMEAFFAAFVRAKKAGSGKPQLIIAKTLIGKGIPEVEGTQKAHGEGGAKFAEAARKALGLPAEPYFVVAGGARVLRGPREGAGRRPRGLDQGLRRLEDEESQAGRGAGRARGPRSGIFPRGRPRRRPRWRRCWPPSPSSPRRPRSPPARPARTCCSRWPRRSRCSSAAAPISTARR